MGFCKLSSNAMSTKLHTLSTMGKKMDKYSKRIFEFLFRTTMWYKLPINILLLTYYLKFSGIEKMLVKLGLQFEGRSHSGLDDSINIARIALELLKVSLFSK